jgi:hypothetical protein
MITNNELENIKGQVLQPYWKVLCENEHKNF